MKRYDKIKEYLTGIILGLIFSILMTVKAMAAVNCPEDAEQESARLYLEENGIEIPEEIETWCEYYGEMYDICPETLEAVCWVESRCTPDAQSADKSCKGLMQIKPSCHRKRMERLGVRNIFGTWENIKTGSDYLAELGGSEDIAVALAIYNGQSAGKIEQAKQGNYTGYVEKVLSISEELERAHGK